MSALNLYHNLIVQGFKLSIANGDKLELVPASRLTDSQRTAIKQHKSELLLLLAANSHNVTCNNCDHLTLTGTCQRLSKRVIPEALRECDSFKLLKSERLSVVKVTPYTATELLTHYEKPLFNHLLACPYCHVEKAQYCLNGYAMGSVYDALLLNRDDAQAKRANLALRVDRAKIKGGFK